MSLIITRSRPGIEQVYVDANIYGEGRWADRRDFNPLNQPIRYPALSTAKVRANIEKSMDPDWDYEITNYER